MADNVKWYGDKVEKQVFDGISKNLDQAAMFWTRYAKRKVSNAAKSRPMDYPGKQSGHLRRNIVHEKVEDLVRRVGTNVLYGKFLELGTKVMQKRPWMTRTNKETRTQLARIIGKKI